MIGALYTFLDDLTGDNLAASLDARLVTPGLGQLVAELKAVHGRPAESVSLDQLLGGYRADVLDRGLIELPRELLTQLLRQPELLLELSDLVFDEGGPYWDELPILEEVSDERVAAAVARVNAVIDADSQPRTLSTPAAARRPSFAFFYPLVASLATAAAVLLGVFAFNQMQKPGGGDTAKVTPAVKGWAGPDGMPARGDDAAAFRHLGQKLQEVRTPPESPTELTRWLGEWRTGCGVLQSALNSPDPFLANADKAKDLAGRCRKWSAEFEKLLQTAEGLKPDQRDELAAVRKSADDLLGRLSKYLDESAGKA